MIKNILITGGAGYIGSHIAEILVKNKKKFIKWRSKFKNVSKIVNSCLKWEKK